MRPAAAEPGNSWRAAALNREAMDKDESGMRENYCFKCGSYTSVEDLTKLCDRCYHGWLDRRQPRG